MERLAGPSTPSAPSRTAAKPVDVGEGAVRGGVHVGEVDHRAHPVEARGELEHVVDRAELADAAHHLDAERDRAILRLELLAQRRERGDNVVERLLGCPAEPEAGVDDDDLRACSGRDPGGAVERAERHLRLLRVRVAREREERRVHRERDLLLARELAEPLRPGVVEPEAALEIELAGGVAALDEQLDGEVGRLPRGAARWADADRSHERDRNGQAVSDSSLTPCQRRLRHGVRVVSGTGHVV